MGSNQQFSLRWNNYLQHITHVFDSLRDDENLVDVTLCCEGKKIRAHKMLLSACSTYFREIFKDNPCQHPIIIFRNVKFEDLEGLISFMYKGEVNVEQESLSSFLSTAELLEVNGLTGGTNSCFPDTVVDDDTVGSGNGGGGGGVSGSGGGSRSKHSSKPDSPMNRKRSGHESPPTTTIQDNIKTEPLDYQDQDCDDYSGGGGGNGGGGGGDEDSTDNKYEPEVSWNNEDNTTDGANEHGNTAGTSNNGNIQDSLQVFAHGLWRRLHPSLKRFGCDECGKVFKHPRSLDHHKKMHEGRTTCPFCRRVFGRMYALRLHMSSSHPGQPMLQSTKSH